MLCHPWLSSHDHPAQAWATLEHALKCEVQEKQEALDRVKSQVLSTVPVNSFTASRLYACVSSIWPGLV